MTIKKRLVLGLGGISFLVLALGSAAAWTVVALKVQITKEIAEDKLLLGLANEMKILALEHRRYEKDTFLNAGSSAKQEEYLEKFDSASQHLRGVIERMLPLLVGDHAPLVANLRAAEEGYALYRTGFLSLAKESIADKSMTAQAANQ
jgi:methyl-accepting chemotaxis protein